MEAPDCKEEKALKSARGALESLIVIESLVRPGGLTALHVGALEALSEKEPLSNGDIAEKLGISAASASRCLDCLVSKGMVRVSLDSRDRRRNSFRLEIRAQSILFEIRRALPGGKAERAAADDATNDAFKLMSVLNRAANIALPSAAGGAAPLSPAALRILLVAEAKGLPAGELARAAGVTSSAASMAFKRLSRDDLIALADSSNGKGARGDRRRRFFRLTCQGSAVVARLLEQFQN